VARSTTKLLKSQSSLSAYAELASAGVLNAAARARGEDSKPALKRLLLELERSPYNVGLLLTIVQIYVSIRNPSSAINLLESFFVRLEQSSSEDQGQVRFSPGLVAIAVALYRSQGRRSRATKELERAASHWRKRPNPPTLLLQAAGATLLESSNAEDISSAAEIFTVLHEKRPDDRIAAAGYVAAHASKDSSKVKDEVARLTAVSQLIQGIDVDNLESAGIPQPANALALAQKTALREHGAPDQASNKSKRIRKSRLPKDYDSSKVPDPERWLPLRDRSTYRPKGKKGRKKDADRTQGGIVAEDVGVKDAAPVVRPAGGGGVGGKKNKKKGKR
jgi:signal recognition particle subunit SRP72